MSRHHNMLIVAAAALVSAALIVPTTGVVAQSWHSVRVNHMPMVEGSGRVVQQTRQVGAFDSVETLGSEDVEVRFGPRPSVVIAADDNILPFLTTEVRAGKLKIGARGSFRMRGPIRVWITTPSLQAFTISGSSNVAIHDVNSNALRLTINGSGDMQANGRTGRLDVDINGSGAARLSSLAATDVSAGLYGSGEAVVRASRLLDARIYGSGTVRYIGKPDQIRSSHFGSGSIVAAN